MTRQRDAPVIGFVTRQEAAEELRCSLDTIDRRVGDGSLDSVKHFGRRLITRASLDAYKAALLDVSRETTGAHGADGAGEVRA